MYQIHCPDNSSSVYVFMTSTFVVVRQFRLIFRALHAFYSEEIQYYIMKVIRKLFVGNSMKNNFSLKSVSIWGLLCAAVLYKEGVSQCQVIRRNYVILDTYLGWDSKTYNIFTLMKILLYTSNVRFSTTFHMMQLGVSEQKIETFYFYFVQSLLTPCIGLVSFHCFPCYCLYNYFMGSHFAHCVLFQQPLRRTWFAWVFLSYVSGLKAHLLPSDASRSPGSSFILPSVLSHKLEVNEFTINLSKL